MTKTLKIYIRATLALLFFVAVETIFSVIQGKEYDPGLVGVMLGFSALVEAMRDKK